MEFDEIMVKESPGLCRCCLSEGCYKDMGTEYAWMNEHEVYADMLLECFDISISQVNDGPNGPNRLICEVCITRLRDACYFKKQVLESEKKFIDMVGRGEFKSKAIMVYSTSMKVETAEEEDAASLGTDDADPEYLDDEIEYLEEDILKAESQEPGVSEVTADPLPVRGKRGRPRKAPVKADKKKVKTEPKPKSSKPVLKENGDAELNAVKRRNRTDLLQILQVIIQNSTIMPFRFHSNQFMCFYCCCPFDSYLKLKQHTKLDHEQAKLNYVINSLKHRRIKLDISDIACKLCPKSIHSLDEFLRHAETVHDLIFNKEVSKEFFTYKLSDELMGCLECNQSFRCFSSLMKHTHKFHNNSHAFICEICGQGFIAKANVSGHIKNVHNQNKCEKCDKVFPSLYSLQNHCLKEHKTNKLKCPKCPELLTSRYLRKRHLALVHNVQGTQYNCDKCPKILPSKARLLEHKARVHLKEKKVTCQICGFKLFNNDLLKKHMVRHDDSRPFECEFCNKTFARKKGLDLHRRIHTNDKRYACKECGKAFVQSTSLKLHVKVHHAGNEKT